MRHDYLLQVTDTLSPASEQRARQAVVDCQAHEAQLRTSVSATEERLRQLRGTGGAVKEGQVLFLLVRSEVVRDLSRLRARWCKARTALDEAEVSLDRILVMREEYVKAVERG